MFGSTWVFLSPSWEISRMYFEKHLSWNYYDCAAVCVCVCFLLAHLYRSLSLSFQLCGMELVEPETKMHPEYCHLICGMALRQWLLRCISCKRGETQRQQSPWAAESGSTAWPRDVLLLQPSSTAEPGRAICVQTFLQLSPWWQLLWLSQRFSRCHPSHGRPHTLLSGVLLTYDLLGLLSVMISQMSHKLKKIRKHPWGFRWITVLGGPFMDQLWSMTFSPASPCSDMQTALQFILWK